jgi:hypothetical protein
MMAADRQCARPEIELISSYNSISLPYLPAIFPALQPNVFQIAPEF